ncbi:MAG: hypothetical protein KME21_16680 [Desmonostoc vinosum HA7617-LM4]|nr:hypothetical protein [Desmonostoc vinosum HA7617-LM4]
MGNGQEDAGTQTKFLLYLPSPLPLSSSLKCLKDIGFGIGLFVNIVNILGSQGSS